MKRLLIILTFILPTISIAQGWIWQAQIQGGTYLKVISMATHSNGKSFVLIEYAGTITISGNSVSSNAGTNDIAVVAFSGNGDFLWAQTIGSNDAEIAASIAIDENNSCLYVNGDFKNTCNFNGIASLTSDGLYDAFLAKYSIDGTLLNAKKIAWGTNSQRAVSLCVDNSGNVVATGIFLDNATFDSGLYLTGSSITSNYVVKYNSSGSILWAKRTLGQYNVSWFRDIKPYSGGYVISGQFRDSLYLDVQTIVSQASNMDMFVYAIDNNGNGQWVRTIKGALGDDQFNKISVSDNIYISGVTKSDTLNVQTGSSAFQKTGIGNSGNFDMIVFSYTTDGSFRWLKKYGSIADDRALYVDANSTHLVIGGYYSGAITVETVTPQFNAGYEGFHALYTKEGALQFLNSFNGASSDYIRTAKFLPTGNQVVAGESNSDQLVFGSTSVTNPAPGNYFGFVAKYGCVEGLSITSTNVSCLDGFGMPVVNDGTATVTATGGREPYSYLWSNGQTTQTAINLSLNTYRVTVTDANNCTISGSVTITATPNVSVAVTAFDNNTCIGGNNGTITVTASNGKLPYTYLWSSIPVQTLPTATGLSAGTYRCTVTDGCGNFAVATKSITSNSNLSATISVTNITCNGLLNGSLTVNPTGNGSPFTYLWSTGATTQTISGLGEGIYSVTVTDLCGSTFISSASVTQPTAIVVNYDLSCTKRNQCTGWAKALPTGGTPGIISTGYFYSWSNGGSTQTISGLCKASYSVTVTDSKGCTKVKTNIRIKDCTPGVPANDTSLAKVPEIIVFPNPASSNINIGSKGQAKIVNIEIFDITGRKCFSMEEALISENAAKIETKDWKKGLYMVVVTADSGISSTRLIIE